ncbi:MAG: serine/threonine protein kinase [Myxococcales bacterium]|nr:serine/threonine protein kinase [Myxococcales bacterium]
MRALVTAVLGLTLAASSVACGRPFDVKTPPGFVELEGQGDYQYRATTPEGVVVAVRVVEDEKRGDLSFWTEALLLQLREISGYALTSSSEITSNDGTKGRLLQFGHDEDNKPYVYWVAIFAAQDRLFLVETGAPKPQFDRARPSVEWTLKSVRVQCSSIVAPVLASRTCNHW